MGTFSINQAGILENWSNNTHVVVGNVQTMVQQSLGQDYTFESFSVLQGTASGSQVHLICKLSRRIYWVCVSSATTVTCKWLNRFHDTVTCEYVQMADLPYAVFSYPDAPITVVCLSPDMIHEVDLPVAEAPNVIGVGKDVETHAISVFTSNGLVLRARYMQLQPQPKGTANDEHAHVLSRHLLAAFWNFYQSRNLQLAPSLQQEDSLERAIVLTATQLQHEGTTGRNPMEWHLAFIAMVKQAGFYKNLSAKARWTLLGIGQEISVAPLLHASSFQLTEPFGLANKLLQIQRHVVDHAPTLEWTIVLDKILEQAFQYREEHGMVTYDVLVDPNDLFTHALAPVLRVQIQELQQLTERLARTALQVQAESKGADIPVALVFDLIRTQLHNDQLAYDLALEHQYYPCLCQLALDHPSKYDLTPILGKWPDFGPYALEWFAKRHRYDKVLSYGKDLPDSFQKLVANTDYAWVAELRQGKYGAVSEALYQSSTGDNIEQTEWNLSMAKLASKVANRKNKAVENKMELVKIHISLFGRDVTPLSTPRVLFDACLQHYDESEDDPIVYAMMGLVVGCVAQDGTMIASVWSKVIASNADIWLSPSSAAALSRDELLQDTMFGRLWCQVQEQPVEWHATMQFDAVQDAVLRNLKLKQHEGIELMRRLHTVTTIALQSIMVAEYEGQ